MGTLWSTPQELAEAVANSVVLTADEFAQTAALDYWEMSAAGHRAVRDLLAGIAGHGDEPDLAETLGAVLARPADPAPVSRLVSLLTTRLIAMAATGGPAGWDELVERAFQADALGRLHVHIGADYTPAAPPVDVLAVPPPERLAAGRPAASRLAASRLAAGRPGGAATDPKADPAARHDCAAVIVVPFRDRLPDAGRLRNTLACLRALGDQSIDRNAYRVVVVEIDDHPRWEGVLRERCDQYLFGACPGHFNKAWAVNLGVVHGAGSAPVLCVLDGDILPDHDFVARNLRRFGRRGSNAHWPFRDALCLDPASTDAAITHRCVAGQPQVPAAMVRGVYLRRPPGHCVWVRTELFHRVGGMDERFVGWGGEDLDFVFRLDVVGAVDRYDDPLLHMYHPRPQIKENGKRFYAGRQLLTWRPAGPIGQFDGPVGSVDDDLAGLIEH